MNGKTAARARVTHVLFDVDGLLLDTEPVYTEATNAVVSRFGKTFDWRLKANMIGRRALDSARYLVRELELPLSAEEYLAERDVILRKTFAACDAMPGAEELVRHLHRHRIPIALATSSAWDLFDIKITRHTDWFALFDARVGGDDVAHGKPAPDIFLEAAARIGADPASTLIFEDAPSGLAAGLAANMRVIAVPDANMDKARYRDADAVLGSLTEFSPEEYGLPGFGGAATGRGGA
ncbi:MAG: HAD-IA family hydrolase [Gammaproteobacteria bacterium]|nr:HAD-IA family hydrolase [Gammaproteobacteria bacterium]